MLNTRIEKTVHVLLLCGALSLMGGPTASLASECVGFENMAVKILKQEYGRVFFALNANLVNACPREVSFVIDLKFVDARGVTLKSLLKPVQALSARGKKTVLYMESLPPNVFPQNRLLCVQGGGHSQLHTHSRRQRSDRRGRQWITLTAR